VALTPDTEDARARKVAEREAAQREMLLREVDEAVRQDQIGGVAKRYGWAIVGAVVLALVVFGGWLFWQDRREAEMEARSEALVTALDQLEAGQLTEGEAALTELSDDGSSAPAIAARFARAGIAINQNRREDAAKLYEQVADDGDAPQPYRDLAAIRLMALRFEEVEPQVVIDRLKPLATPGQSWFGSAGELVGMAYLKQGKKELAGPLFAEIAKDESVPRSLRSRARQLSGLLGYDAVEDVDAALAEMGVASDASAPPASAQPTSAPPAAEPAPASTE
jgi:hypothetical protein